MDPVGGSSPAASENEAATQHLKSLLGFFGGGGGSGSSAGGLLSGLLGGGAGNSQQQHPQPGSGEGTESLTNGASASAASDMIVDSDANDNDDTPAAELTHSGAPIASDAVADVSAPVNGADQTLSDGDVDLSDADEPKPPSTPRKSGHSDTISSPPKNLDCSPRR